MGFEYASIKLLFPDPRCRLHLFLRRLRLNAASVACCCCLLLLPVVAACCRCLLLEFFEWAPQFFRICRIRPYFQNKRLPVIAPKPPPASELDSRITGVAVGSDSFWNSSFESWAQDQRVARMISRALQKSEGRKWETAIDSLLPSQVSVDILLWCSRANFSLILCLDLYLSSWTPANQWNKIFSHLFTGAHKKKSWLWFSEEVLHH